MADPDPNTPQVVDPERVVDLTRLLQIRGPLGVLNVLDTIVPVVNMGDVVTRSVTVRQPLFSSSTVFSAGLQTAAPINTVHADTGPLTEGDYDIIVNGFTQSTNTINWAIEHRNAANTANLAIWHAGTWNNGNGPGFLPEQRFGYAFSINERLRIINLATLPAGNVSAMTIFARIRS